MEDKIQASKYIAGLKTIRRMVLQKFSAMSSLDLPQVGCVCVKERLRADKTAAFFGRSCAH